MNKSADLAIKKLKKLLEPRGAKADFCRKTGIARSLLDIYLAGGSRPGLDQIDKFAEALGIQSWELIKPDGAIPTPAQESPTVESLTKIIAEQEKRIQALESKETQGNVPLDLATAFAIFENKDWEHIRVVVNSLLKAREILGKKPEKKQVGR